jgi:TolB-like protein/class 3 adenylate cyclase
MILQPPTSSRKLAAILSADIAGYSALMSADEEATVRKLRQVREAVLPIIESFGGRVIDLAGDGILAEFPSAVRAVESAAAVQVQMDALNAELAPPMLFRIGVNVGDVIHEGERLYGDGINVAARLQAIAEPGAICISSKVHEEVRDRLPVAFKDIGEQELKNIPRPVRAFSSLPPTPPTFIARFLGHLSHRLAMGGRIIASVALIGAVASGLLGYRQVLKTIGFDFSTNEGARTVRATIAILPFTSLGIDSGRDYFADGVTEDMISSIGRFREISVISPAGVATYKNKTASPEKIGYDLRVKYVVEGTIRRSADRVRVTANLTETTRNVLLWSERFDAELKDIFAVQDQITHRISGAIVAKVTALEIDRAKAKPASNLEAYDLVLRGRDLLARLTRPNNAEARKLFERATELDPNYAPAYIGLGRTYRYSVIQGWSSDPQTTLREAETFARKAILIDPQNPGAHALLGQILVQFGDYDGALDELRRAVDLNPSDADAYSGLTPVLLWRGDTLGAISAGETLRLFQPELSARIASPSR